MMRRLLTLMYFLRFTIDRLTGRSHNQETVMLRRPGPRADAPAVGRGAGPTMILKIRLNGRTRMIVLPIA